jgi:hypothetical protein
VDSDTTQKPLPALQVAEFKNCSICLSPRTPKTAGKTKKTTAKTTAIILVIRNVFIIFDIPSPFII